MTIGYRNSSGTDLDSLFMPYTSGAKAGTTGLRNSAGTDLKDIYQAYTLGSKRAAVGYRNSAGTDLSDLFQNSDVPLFTVDLQNHLADSYGFLAAFNAAAYVGYWNDGQVHIQINVSGTPTSSYSTWGTPTGGTPGNGYWIRATLNSGSTPSGSPLNTWLQLSSTRSWSNFKSLSSPGQVVCELTIEISPNADGSGIIDSAIVTLSSSVES